MVDNIDQEPIESIEPTSDPAEAENNQKKQRKPLSQKKKPFYGS